MRRLSVSRRREKLVTANIYRIPSDTTNESGHSWTHHLTTVIPFVHNVFPILAAVYLLLCESPTSITGHCSRPVPFVQKSCSFEIVRHEDHFALRKWPKDNLSSLTVFCTSLRSKTTLNVNVARADLSSGTILT